MNPLHAHATPIQPAPSSQQLHSPTDQSGDLAVDRSEAPERRSRLPRALILICFIGLFARSWLVMTPAIGYFDDLNFFRDWTRSLHEHGLGKFFGETGFCDYPPVWLLVMWTIGHVASWFELGLANENLLISLLKTPACLADLLIAVLLYFETRRIIGPRAASGACALYFLHPLSIYNSAYWGQVDAVHSAFCLLALVLVNRRRLGLAGAAAAFAILQKFQAIALLPIVIFECYRVARFRGLSVMGIGFALMAATVAAPFAMNGVLREVLDRAYVHVIGQYSDMSRSAYNLWWMFGDPRSSDLAVPAPIVEIAAQGRDTIAYADSWLMRLSWRRISLIIYSLSVALVLSAYARRPSAMNRFGAAGLLGLAFFLFPTEMHERYALPAIAFLPIWAVVNPWRERVFLLVSVLLLLNVADYLPAKSISAPISFVNLVLFGSVLLWMLFAPMSGRTTTVERPMEEARTAQPVLIKLFQFATVASVCLFIGCGAWIFARASNVAPPPVDPNELHLGAIGAKTVEQGWGELRVNRSVGGGPIHLGDQYYLRGIGTHAKSKLVYSVPEGAARFEALVGIDRVTGGRGSVRVAVDVDGKEAFGPKTLTGQSNPEPVSVSVHGAKTITLRADPTDDGPKADHVDWALARFIRDAP